jgi:hypothetical protein
LVVARCVTFLSIGCVRRHGRVENPGPLLQQRARFLRPMARASQSHLSCCVTIILLLTVNQHKQ